MITASGYHYISKNYPTISLPYKNEIFRLEKIVLDNLNQIISAQEENINKLLNKLKTLGNKTDLKPPKNPTQDLKPLIEEFSE